MKIRTNNKAGQAGGPIGPYPAQFPYQSPGDAMLPLQRPSTGHIDHPVQGAPGMKLMEHGPARRI